MLAGKVEKFYRDVIQFQRGDEESSSDPNARVIVYDPNDPLGGERLRPGEDNPICSSKCKLFLNCAEHPFMPFQGSTNPLITIILENISPKEDIQGGLGTTGFNGQLRGIINDIALECGVDPMSFRWLSAVRCANREKKPVNFKPKAGWCRHFMVDDLRVHRPRFIIPVGTIVLGALSHKSNANDWGGRLLTYRGWPDDWLTNPKFAREREHPIRENDMIVGHPLFGPIPARNTYIPMMPIIHPRLVAAARNPYVEARWKASIKRAILAAKNGTQPLSYTRPWYNVLTDPDAVEAALNELLSIDPLDLCYDTETTGVLPWATDAAIVFMMFRWADPATGQPKSLGFPWNYIGLDFNNLIRPAIKRLTPLVLAVLYRHRLIGHNLPFDVLYSFGTLEGADIDQLANAATWDTWHMIYTLRQKAGTLGLEAITYEYVPELAGYEEEMQLLIELDHDILHPEGGGHYANCPRHKWKTHLIPYVMGDVETCYLAKGVVAKKLTQASVYQIPLANPTKLGRFRSFVTPRRDWVYEKIMAPASSVLMKMMGRGMEIDTKDLTRLEEIYPRQIDERKEIIKEIDERIIDWCEDMARQDPAWELDLENKDHLKKILYDILDMPINRLTKSGKKIYGEEPEAYAEGVADGTLTREELLAYAALDKFTLNRMAVDNEKVRPLQEYRKIYKLYTTYVRPLRNAFKAGLDKRQRTQAGHLCRDGRIHASFLLTGTRGGRLSCKNPNLQQLPREGDVKSMFISRWWKMGRKGCLYQGDLSQIELRLLAAGCGDPTMVKAYFDDVDLHSLTTSRIFKVPYEHFSKDYMKALQKAGKDKEAKDLDQKRQVGKTVNFLTGYGGGAFGLQNTLAARSIYLPIEECEKIIESFFDSYPALKLHLQHYKHFIMENAVAVSIFGRVRIFEEVHSEDKEAISKALRAGCNHLIQSTASDMMLIALVAIEALMREAGLESLLISTVHDSLLIDALQEELPKIHEIVTLVLNNFDQILPAYFGDDYDTSWMIVPFTGDCEVGINYLEQKKVPKEGLIDWQELLYPKMKKAA